MRIVSKDQNIPKGSVFLFVRPRRAGELKPVYYVGTTANADGLVWSTKIYKAWHNHSIFAAHQMLDEFRKVNVDVELRAVPSFCGYCSGG